MTVEAAWGRVARDSEVGADTVFVIASMNGKRAIDNPRVLQAASSHARDGRRRGGIRAVRPFLECLHRRLVFGLAIPITTPTPCSTAGSSRVP